MAKFTDFFFGSNIAVWEEAIGEVFEQLEDQRQVALAAIYLSSAAISELSDRYATLTGGKIDPSWQIEVFREHLQETIQAFLMESSTAAGISQVVAATTMIPPAIRSLSNLSRWLLGFQYLVNRFFSRMDGFIVATIDGPYQLNSSNNKLLVKIDGGPTQVVTLPTGDAVNALVLVDSINSQLSGGKATLFGRRLLIETTRNDVSGSIQIEAPSTADTVLGLDNIIRQNAIPPTGVIGTMPFGWRVTAPFGSTSVPANIDQAMFGTGAAVIRGEKDSPFPGLISGSLLKNGGFESGFTGWDRLAGPDFFITNTRYRSGSHSLAVRTAAGKTNKIVSDQMFLTGGCDVQVLAYHQAQSEGEIYKSAASAPTKFRWTVGNTVYGYNNGQETTTAVPNGSNASTVKLTDTTVDFLAKGVKIGMAVHVEEGGKLYDGLITGVSTNDLFIDFWRNGPNGDAETTQITGGATAAPSVSYTVKSISDSTKSFTGLNIRVGANSTLRDKIRVKVGTGIFGFFPRQEVRDIIGVSPITLTVQNWGGGPTPPNNTAYSIYHNPIDGQSYRVFSSLAECPTVAGGTPNSVVSANFNYTLTFYDEFDSPLGSVTTGNIRPTPSGNYVLAEPTGSDVTLESVSPVGTVYARLSIVVSPDINGNTGTPALATIDDISVTCVNGAAPELHIASDSRIQKIPFINEAHIASGVLAWTKRPANGDIISVGAANFEFDTGAQATGTLTYSGQPSDGDTFQLGSVVFEFDTNCVVSPNNVQVIVGADADSTFTNLRAAIAGFIGSAATTVLDTGANTLKFTAKVFGVTGNSIAFNKDSTAITLSPATGFLSGGELPSVDAGNIPIPIALTTDAIGPATIDEPYGRLTTSINQNAQTVRASFDPDNNVIVIQALSDGLAGNDIPFSGIAHLSAFTFAPSTGRLTGGTSTVAGANITYTGQPSDGDVVVLGQTGYEFDSNGSGVCGNALLVPISASGIGVTYSGFVSLVNGRGEVVAALDVTQNKIGITAGTTGVSGNTITARESSAVLSINASGGDSSAQSATATGGTSRSYSAGLVAYEATLTPPVASTIGSFATISGVQSVTIVPAASVVAGSRVIVCVSTNSTTQDPTPPTCTDSKGLTYTLDASISGGVNGDIFIFSGEAANGLSTTDSITVSVASGQNFNGAAVSAIAVTGLCTADQSAAAFGSGTSFAVGPTAALSVSGEFVLAAFSVLGPQADTFTPPSGYTTIGRAGTIVDANQATISPTYKILSSSTLSGAQATGFADPANPTCDEVVAYLNPRLSGITAFCETVSGVFPHGRVGFRSLYSGVNSTIVLGHGSANRILGFDNDKGVQNALKYRRPAWEIAAGGSGVITLVTRAVPPAAKYFGTEWHLRFWTRAYHPSGIAVSGLTVSGIIGYAEFKFDSGVRQVGTPVRITETPTVVEVVDLDPGQRFSDITAQITFSGVTSGVRVVTSEPYLINETSKSLHLADNTIPRNKQREYRAYRMTIANPDSFTAIEAGLVGLIDDIDSELVSLEGIEFTQLDNKNLFHHSEQVATLGVNASGEIAYTANPSDGDKIRLGDDIYEFDNNFSISTDSIQVVLGPTADVTFQNLVEQIFSNSVTHTATIDTDRNVVNIQAASAGVSGNALIFTATYVSTDTVAYTLSPLTAFLEGGVDPIEYTRDIDYTIRYDTGQLARTGSSAIPTPSPADLAISYSFYPGDIASSDSYPQNIKPVGAKVEPDSTASFFFFGNRDDWTSVTGINTNFTVVDRSPTRFSYLKPIERGKFAEVVVFSGVTFSGLGPSIGMTFSGLSKTAPLSYTAKTDFDALLVKNGVPLPQDSSWTFVNDKTIALLNAEVDPSATYEIEYHLKFQYTTPPIAVPESGSTYVLLPYSYKVKNANEVFEDVQKVLSLDENRQAKLSLPAVTDQTLAELEQTISGETTIINDEFWQFVDESTVEVFVAGFDEAATYTLTYKSRRIDFVSPVIDQWEYATGSGTTYGPFTPFEVGDKVRLLDVAKFRVTTAGDFDVDDYRVRSVAGILDTPQVSACGFGIEPFGKLPFGGCGLEVSTDPAKVQKALGGKIFMDGSLSTVVSQALPLVLAPGRWHIGFDAFNNSSQNISATFGFGSPVWAGRKAQWTGIASAGTGLNGTGTVAMALYEADAVGQPTNRVYTTGIVTPPASSPWVVSGISAITTTEWVVPVFWTGNTRGMFTWNPATNYMQYGLDGFTAVGGYYHWIMVNAAGPQASGGFGCTGNFPDLLLAPQVFIQLGGYLE